ncbi:MAG: hypothetical protein GXO00_00295 [Candidatus Diapherotrites archaeon]|nr:hypothetical protein [Candidatus Diapherotrites archaeon]
MEIDLRKAGKGCADNPVAILSDFIAKGTPLCIILRRDQEDLVKELLDIGGYRVVQRREEGEYVVVEARR